MGMTECQCPSFQRCLHCRFTSNSCLKFFVFIPQRWLHVSGTHLLIFMYFFSDVYGD